MVTLAGSRDGDLLAVNADRSLDVTRDFVTRGRTPLIGHTVGEPAQVEAYLHRNTLSSRERIGVISVLSCGTVELEPELLQRPYAALSGVIIGAGHGLAVRGQNGGGGGIGGDHHRRTARAHYGHRVHPALLVGDVG